MPKFDENLPHELRVALVQKWEKIYERENLKLLNNFILLEDDHQENLRLIEEVQKQIDQIKLDNPEIAEIPLRTRFVDFNPRLNTTQRKVVFAIRKLNFRDEMIDLLIETASESEKMTLENEKESIKSQLKEIENNCKHEVHDCSAGGGDFCSICSHYFGLYS